VTSSKTAKAAVEPVRQRTQYSCGSPRPVMTDWGQQPLGQMSDGQIARVLGMSQSTVTKARQRLGIPSFQAHTPTDWLNLPWGEKSDADIAATLGISRQTIQRKRTQLGFSKIKVGYGIDWDAQPLGKMTDISLADLLKVDPSAVKQARTRRRIAGFIQPPEWDKDLLGEVPDSTIARMFHISKAAVGVERRRRGIARADLLCLTTEDESANQEEALIDLYWHEHHVPHQFQVQIGPYVADWVIHKDTVVEYAGFCGHPKIGAAYNARLGEKVRFYKKQGWDVLVLKPSDLPSYTTSHVPKFRHRSCCAGCGRRFRSREGIGGGLVRRATTTLCDPCWKAVA
jgi:biotin operon repressor